MTQYKPRDKVRFIVGKNILVGTVRYVEGKTVKIATGGLKAANTHTNTSAIIDHGTLYTVTTDSIVRKVK